MGSREGNSHFSVFDGVKTFPLTPEALMAEINTSITNLEYAHVTALLDSPSSSLSRNKGHDSPKYDARMTYQAYKDGCSALAAGKLDEAFHSLNVSLSKCPHFCSPIADRHNSVRHLLIATFMFALKPNSNNISSAKIEIAVPHP